MAYLGNSLGIGSSAVTASASALSPFTNTYSVDFDGTDDYAAANTVATSYASDTTGSVSAWIKMDDATPASASTIFSISDASSGTYMSLYVNPEGRLTFVVQKSGTNQVFVRTDPASFVDATWYHVAVVQDGVQPVLYINGSAPTQANFVSTDLTAFLADLTGLDVCTIGALRYINTTTLYWSGLIEETAYFSGTALSAAQIAAIYNGGEPADLTSYSPSGWWRFEEGSGTSIADSSGNGHTATLTNGPTFSTDVPT